MLQRLPAHFLWLFKERRQMVVDSVQDNGLPSPWRQSMWPARK